MYSVLSKIINDKLLQVESLTNQEEVELRAKIEALGSEVTKVPSKSAQDLDEVVFKAVFQPTKCFEDKIDCFTALSSMLLLFQSPLLVYCVFIQIEIAKELDKLSSKLDDVDKMISSDPEVRSLLSSTADVWMPVITANSNERRNFTATFADDNHEVQGKDSKQICNLDCCFNILVENCITL